MRGKQVEGGVTPQTGLGEGCTRSSGTGQPTAVLAMSGTQSALTSQEDRSGSDSDSQRDTGESLGSHLFLFIWHLPPILSN